MRKSRHGLTHSFFVERQTMKKISILSLSLLTVMAGAAVAPALGVIKEYFSDADPIMIQLIISTPAVFIFLTSFIFPKLADLFRVKTLVIIGLALYVLGGCLAGLFNNIWIVLLFRALVGMGVGIIMPLSTGLLSFYYPPDQLDKLMGLSSAMNQMGGVIATLIAGVLAAVSWRASFLVYLLGLICTILCLLFLPNDKLSSAGGSEESTAAPGKRSGRSNITEEADEIRKRHPFIRYYSYIISMFLLMMIFFLYPTNFAIETAKDGIISQQWIAVIMAFMDLVAFFGGLSFIYIKKLFKNSTLLISPVLFLIGYLFLSLGKGWIGALIGSAIVGFANGSGVPAIISAASLKAGKSAVSTVMPLISAALYLAQFLTPFAMSAISWINVPHLPYWFAAALSLVLFIWTLISFRKSK